VEDGCIVEDSHVDGCVWRMAVCGGWLYCGG
jgi:hypothetical protein